jgi:hypothetical protein
LTDGNGKFEKVYGVTVTDRAFANAVKGFAEWQTQVTGQKVSETTALRLMAERYAMLNFSQRSALEHKIRWTEHRNHGFRRLTSFAETAHR